MQKCQDITIYIYGKVSDVISMTNTAVGHKDLLRINFYNCLQLLCRSINSQRSSEVG